MPNAFSYCRSMILLQFSCRYYKYVLTLLTAMAFSGDYIFWKHRKTLERMNMNEQTLANARNSGKRTKDWL